MAFGFGFPKLPTQAFAADPSMAGQAGSGLTLADKLMAVGSVLNGHPEIAMQLPLMAAARRQFQAQQDATGDLANYASGRPSIIAPPIKAQSGDAVADAAPPMTVDAGAMGNVPVGASSPKLSIDIPQFNIPAPGSPPTAATLRGAMPMLAKLAARGGNIQPWVDMLKGAQPDLQFVNGVGVDTHDPTNVGKKVGASLSNVNGFMVDTQDPSNANRFLPKIADGAEPLYDKNGNVVAQRLLDGTVGALQQAAQATAAGTEAGKLPYVGPTAEAQSAGQERGKAPFTLVTKDVNGVPTTMTQQQALGLAGGAAPTAATGMAGSGGLDPKAFYKGFVLQHEGKLNPADLNGSPTMYGFNQAANPDINVKSLTPDSAAERFANKYFAQSGAANLPPALAAVHADTYFINPSKAQQLLQASGGDPGKYMDMRETWLNHLAQTNPDAAKYAQAWANRNADLRQVAQQLQQTPGPQSGAPAGGTPGFHGVNADDQKKVATYMEDARAAEDVVQKAHQFQDLNKQQSSGPFYRPLHLPIPWTQGVDINVPGAIARQYGTGVPAMENLSMQMAAGLRAPGQRLTQAEIMKNLETVPSVKNLPAQNDTMVSGYEGRASIKRAYANFMSDWLAKNGSLNGADQAWAQQQSPAGAAAASAGSKSAPAQQIRLKSGGVATVIPVG